MIRHRMSSIVHTGRSITHAVKAFDRPPKTTRDSFVAALQPLVEEIHVALTSGGPGDAAKPLRYEETKNRGNPFDNWTSLLRNKDNDIVRVVDDALFGSAFTPESGDEAFHMMCKQFVVMCYDFVQNIYPYVDTVATARVLYANIESMTKLYNVGAADVEDLCVRFAVNIYVAAIAVHGSTVRGLEDGIVEDATGTEKRKRAEDMWDIVNEVQLYHKKQWEFDIGEPCHTGSDAYTKDVLFMRMSDRLYGELLSVATPLRRIEHTTDFNNFANKEDLDRNTWELEMPVLTSVYPLELTESARKHFLDVHAYFVKNDSAPDKKMLDKHAKDTASCESSLRTHISGVDDVTFRALPDATAGQLNGEDVFNFGLQLSFHGLGVVKDVQTVLVLYKSTGGVRSGIVLHDSGGGRFQDHLRPDLSPTNINTALVTHEAGTGVVTI